MKHIQQLNSAESALEATKQLKTTISTWHITATIGWHLTRLTEERDQREKRKGGVKELEKVREQDQAKQQMTWPFITVFPVINQTTGCHASHQSDN